MIFSESMDSFPTSTVLMKTISNKSKPHYPDGHKMACKLCNRENNHSKTVNTFFHKVEIEDNILAGALQRDLFSIE